MRLRPLRQADIAHLAWVVPVAREIQHVHWSDASALVEAMGNSSVLTNAERTVLIAYDDATPVPTAATIDFLAVAADCRRRGIGGRTALALERRLKKSIDAIYVAVPASIGLALYFWLRLGYRPLKQREWPNVRGGNETCVWLTRSD